MFNKELKKEVKEIKDFLYESDIAFTTSLSTTSTKFDNAMEAPGDLEKANKRIDELEAKVNALMELLAVKEIQPETERKLKKGNNEVVIGKKYIVWGGRK